MSLDIWDNTPSAHVYYVEDGDFPEIIESRDEVEIRSYFPCNCGNCMDCLGLTYRDFM